MKTRVLLGLGLSLLVAAPLAYAVSTPPVHSVTLGIRDHINGQFESATGIPVYLGTIDATTTSKTNHEATTPFNNTGNALCGKMLLIQNAGAIDIRLHPVTTNTGTTTNTPGTGFGPAIGAGERVVVFMPQSSRCWMAAITTSSTASVHFWELQ